MATIKIGNASIDENGNTTGGTVGDQTGKEVYIQDFYVHSLGWYVIRPKTATNADALGEAMTIACNNDNIGYSQATSGTAATQRTGVVKYGIDTTTACNCDCSSLVRACIIYALGVDPGNFTTGNEATKLAATGLFEDKFAYTSSTTLYAGDVLVTKSKGHTAIVTSGNSRSSTTSSSSSSSSSGNTSYCGTGKGTATATGSVNIRSAASSSSTKLDTITKGTQVEVLSLEDTWYKIVWPGASCGYAYTASKYYTYEGASLTSTTTTTTISSSSTSGSSSSTSTSSVTATSAASKKNTSYSGTYITTANLNMRNGAGTSYSIMVTLPKGTSVKNYGYYSLDSSNTEWLYVQVTYNSVKYTGFCSSDYLSKS